MIVNPQLFNYRLITGSLIVGIAVLSIFSFTNYQSIEARQQFLKQEKKLVEIELSQMIKRYDEVSQKNNLITSQLELANNTTENALDSVRLLRSQLSIIPKLQHQVSDLKSKNSVLISTVNAVNLKNAELEKDNIVAYNTLEKLSNINTSLSEENKSLNGSLKKASVLTANSFSAMATKKVFGKTVVTSKASKAESIEVSFTIGENVFADASETDIYIQILTPENNVFADKGAINFGESSLIYSSKKIVPYNNQVLEVSIAINAEDDDQPLTKGTYFITVFNKDRKLGSTQLQLD
ncbi:MAG TPA: hypothetical protein VGA80_05145 [Flavobacteriaceae bacterium]